MRQLGLYILIIALFSITGRGAFAAGPGGSSGSSGKGTIGLVCRSAIGTVLSTEVVVNAQNLLPDDLLMRTHNAFERNLNAQYCGLESLPTDFFNTPALDDDTQLGPVPAEKDPAQNTH